MTNGEVLASVHRRVVEVRRQCIRLQRLEARHKGKGIAKLRRMAAVSDPYSWDVIDLCQLLFRGRDGGPLRQRWSVSWMLIGAASSDDCPCAPYYVSQGLPFYIATGFRHMGMPEPAEDYLSYCLEAGLWNSEPYRDGDREQLLAAASALVGHGPWSRPLRPDERDWLLAQIPVE
jgi:hypothetical protein